MTTEREPRTEAGRALIVWLKDDDDLDDYERVVVYEKVLAIEAEAAREALERVRRAVEAVGNHWCEACDEYNHEPCAAVTAAIEEAFR